MEVLLANKARVIRSKNAGPYELTFDFLFQNDEEMTDFYASLTEQRIAALLQMKPSDVLLITVFPPASAVKVTVRRPRVSGDFGETDVYGAQQHIPWLDYRYSSEAEQ